MKSKAYVYFKSKFLKSNFLMEDLMSIGLFIDEQKFERC